MVLNNSNPPLASRPSSIDRFGLVCAILAHTLWGLFPIYWRLIGSADSAELVCHRIVWSFFSLAILIPILLRMGWWGGWRIMVESVCNRRVWLIHSAAAVMIAVNWLAFIWAVNNDRVLEASLGYYINPLFNVLLGVFVLGERLGRYQWIAVAIAAFGVGIMAIGGGGLPWVSLAMATTFAVYGLLKKKAHLPVLVGLAIEVTVLVIPAAIYLSMQFADGVSAMQTGSPLVQGMLLMAGVVTITPLALFGAAVRRVDLSVIGILQYIGPTLQFLVGAVLYREPLGGSKVAGFVFVWIALIVFLAATHRPQSSPFETIGALPWKRLLFRWRTLMILALIAAAFFAWIAKPWVRARTERPIVKRNQAAGGSEPFDYSFDATDMIGTSRRLDQR
ncbi:EamA-like transporter family protein [Novipirellula aureliae]|uniref:EamA-like transporter family protein n=1 Tax=Novipirellula aureliae TaxID=2527966 RepID=A0A5C6E7Y7_9BACT|nr:EamA family transporter RarD [Novipirellula aureliae]TWU45082.1 EamA-like transporter family protein [Novipirellula aureliae]